LGGAAPNREPVSDHEAARLPAPEFGDTAAGDLPRTPASAVPNFEGARPGLGTTRRLIRPGPGRICPQLPITPRAFFRCGFTAVSLRLWAREGQAPQRNRLAARRAGSSLVTKRRRRRAGHDPKGPSAQPLGRPTSGLVGPPGKGGATRPPFVTPPEEHGLRPGLAVQRGVFVAVL